MSDSGSGLASARRVWRERCRASGSGRLLVTQEEELSHSPAEVDRDAHRCGLGKVQLHRHKGVERGMEVQERWQWLPGAQSGPFYS